MTYVVNMNCKSIPLSMVAECDHLIGDPPYSRHVHGNAVSASGRRGTRKRTFGFDHLDPTVRRWAGRAASAVKKWSILYSDVEMSTYLRISCEVAGAQYIRTIPWVRWSMPLLNGDRPAQGFEHVLFFWGAQGGVKRWNGPGSLVSLNHAGGWEQDEDRKVDHILTGEDPDPLILPSLLHTCLRGETKHKAEKPLDQLLDFVCWFTNRGDRILDPWAGHATAGLASLLLGREYVGVELDPAWCDKSNERLSRGTLTDSDVKRIRKWVVSSDDTSAPATELSKARAERRAQDKKSLAWI